MRLVEKYDKLSTEELFILSLEKDEKKRSTKSALVAQKILWKRAGYPFLSEDHFIRDHTMVRKF